MDVPNRFTMGLERVWNEPGTALERVYLAGFVTSASVLAARLPRCFVVVRLVNWFAQRLRPKIDEKRIKISSRHGIDIIETLTKETSMAILTQKCFITRQNTRESKRWVGRVRGGRRTAVRRRRRWGGATPRRPRRAASRAAGRVSRAGHCTGGWWTRRRRRRSRPPPPPTRRPPPPSTRRPFSRWTLWWSRKGSCSTVGNDQSAITSHPTTPSWRSWTPWGSTGSRLRNTNLHFYIKSYFMFSISID